VRLAAGLHRLAHEGRLAPDGIASLYAERLDGPGEAVRFYFELAGRVRAGRGRRRASPSE
jgi:hypothetical protein